MCEGVKQLVLFFCQSVCQSSEKIWNLNTDMVKTDKHWNCEKKFDVCVPDREQSGSTLCFSSCFLFNIETVHYYTVNTLDMIHLGHTQTWHISTNTLDTVDPGHMQTRQVSSLYLEWEAVYVSKVVFFQKVFVPGCTLEETEKVSP